MGFNCNLNTFWTERVTEIPDTRNCCNKKSFLRFIGFFFYGNMKSKKFGSHKFSETKTPIVLIQWHVIVQIISCFVVFPYFFRPKGKKVKREKSRSLALRIKTKKQKKDKDKDKDKEKEKEKKKKKKSDALSPPQPPSKSHYGL